MTLPTAPGVETRKLILDESQPLVCTEVWGGNRKVARPVELPGLTGWVFASPLDEQSGGGDLHYLSACGKGYLARVLLADVSGHGPAVSAIAERLRHLMHEHINAWDQTALMAELNNAFRIGLGPARYATAALLGVYRVTGEAVFTNAGHPLPLWYHAGSGTWEFLQEDSRETGSQVAGLPVGLIKGTQYHQTAVQLEPGDALILYTDALTEARNEREDQFEPEGFLAAARRLPREMLDDPMAVGRALLEAIREHRGSAVRDDDETLIVLVRAAAESG